MCCREDNCGRLQGEEEVALRAPRPMRRGAVCMFGGLRSISFPLLAFLAVFASLIAGVGIDRRECRICRDLMVGREVHMRNRSRARARILVRGGVVVYPPFGFVGEAIPSLLVTWRGFLVLRLARLLRWFCS